MFAALKYGKYQPAYSVQNGILARACALVAPEALRLHVKLLAILRTHRLQSPV